MCVCLFVRVFCSKEESQEVGYCTHLEWVSPRASAFTQLLMLAAAFQGGVCLYHVALPKLREQHKKGFNDPKVPTASTKLGQTPALKPIMGVARWRDSTHVQQIIFPDPSGLKFAHIKTRMNYMDEDHCWRPREPQKTTVKNTNNKSPNDPRRSGLNACLEVFVACLGKLCDMCMLTVK